MSKYNIWNKWDPLEAIMLGSSYTADFFRDMKDERAKSALQRIADETCEDLEGFERVLKDFGCEVIRPEIDPNFTIQDYLDTYEVSRHKVPRAPLQPRDLHLVAGQKTLCTPGGHPAITKALMDYDAENTYQINRVRTWPKFIYEHLKAQHDNWPDYEDYYKNWKAKSKEHNIPFDKTVVSEIMEYHDDFDFPVGSANTFPVGTRLYANTEKFRSARTLELAKRSGWLKDFDVHWHEFDGHTDGNFHPIKPGALISLLNVMHYEETFPGWDVLHLPDQSWDKVEGFLQLKDQVDGKWWVPGEEKNDRLTHFVETWLNDWVGYVEETVFDVNVLMLDEYHCCVSNPNNEEVNAFLKKHNVEPVYVPWRHRYFWDGGLHCITLDLRRRGKQQDYFK